MSKSNKLTIKTSDDVNIKYSELCDCDEIYIINIGDSEFAVSYRYWDEMKEPQIWILGDKDDYLICTTRKLTTATKKNVLKYAFISYMVGNNKLKIEE